MLVFVKHPSLGIGKTRLSADVAAAASSSTVENYQGFATDDYIVFGKLGEENSEIVLLTSVTANATLGHTTGPVFAHAARTSVSEIKYNQAKIYTATSETGTYSLLTTLDLAPDEDYTVYDHTTGTSATWYKTKYYNETTEATSSYSDPVEGVGYTETSLYSITDEVLEEFGDLDSKEITRKRVRNSIRAAVRKLTLELIKVLPDYRRNYDTQTLTSGTATYDLPTRFLAFQRVDVDYSGTSATGAYKAAFESESEGEPDTTYQKTDPRVFFRGDTFGLRPTPDGTGTAFLWYWDYPEIMTEENDVHGLPHGAREAIVSYSLYRLWLPKNREKSFDYKKAYTEDKGNYIDFIARARQFYTHKKVEIIFGHDLYNG